MAEVLPFRALHYDFARESAQAVACPPYDIISESEKKALLAKSPHNFVRILLPESYGEAAELLGEWIAKGILVEDDKSAFFVLRQDFEFGGKQFSRPGLIGIVKLEPFEKKIVLAHEKTSSGPKEDRTRLMDACHANTEFIWSMFEDESGKFKAILEKSMHGIPLAEATDRNGVKNVLWKISDLGAIEALETLFKGRRIFIADGHHRYTAALNYAKSLPRADGGVLPQDYFPMLLSEMSDPGLMIFSTHRLCRKIPEEALEGFVEKLSENFSVEKISGKNPSAAMEGKNQAFVLYIKGSFFLVSLKNPFALESLSGEDASHSSDWKNLDVTVLHSLIIKPLLGIDGADFGPDGKISYSRDLKETLSLVDSGDFQLAFLMNFGRVGSVKMIALNGEVMPHKSTYFWPKPLSGLVMRKF
ncbi:MAG: DUF1015 domain-containing protein [Candidatus Diapherotrites archaeon]|nr:DUF1015 domain-containing protein [Candidatus Diapherotrites archaeon]